ncbi:MAG: glycosyltransferase family 2 protein [Bacteroidota bacterium]|nr:glycosyltransferase family 2 protein [Bacteroidota bacterium]MDP4217810.1 glycosyltransferase family 2 protein [Bacteroidota bacterium]MDP4258168.1 glycosyltransferase family 2 protein [Bacteroidota bacterium]
MKPTLPEQSVQANAIEIPMEREAARKSPWWVPRRIFAEQEEETYETRKATPPKPHLYLAIFGTWVFCLFWFDPRLFKLLDIAHNWKEDLALGFFIFFVNMAWLYGLYNVCIVVFGLYYRLFKKAKPVILQPSLLGTEELPAVAILYTTCNDFVEESVLSCVRQDYPNYKVYMLDDSSHEEQKHKVDQFAARYPGLVQVVRRPDRKAFKAGNINHGLANATIKEPYFAIADADEILPTDFLRKIVPVMENDPTIGFVQANHRSNPDDKTKLAKEVGPGIDVHWKYYQPLRNDFGFVMFLGHGAVLRRKCWEEVGGFPDIVSEDLGFAIAIREKGYRGRFEENVICYESFPETVRAFRVRHMKWTRGTSEFLSRMFGPLLRSRNIPWMEKLDILFPTLNLPLTLVYFIFMLNANIVLPLLFGKIVDITWVFHGRQLTMPVVVLRKGFEVIYQRDFYFITILTFLSPVLCFFLAFYKRPLKLFRFLSHSTVLYAALAPLSSIGVMAYLYTRKAIFLVTGDVRPQAVRAGVVIPADRGFLLRLKKGWHQVMTNTHPDHAFVQWFEIGMGILFGVLSIITFQLSCLGLSLSFILLPILHRLGWKHPVMRVLVYVPFVLIIGGIALMSMSAFGVQSVFFGYGFHF